VDEKSTIATSAGDQKRAQRSKHLWLEPSDGSPIKEYTIENGLVRVRTVNLTAPSPTGSQDSWEQLSPADLRFHVEHHTIVAQWLELRLGWRRLLGECLRDAEKSPGPA
jgi:hypothetical protein